MTRSLTLVEGIDRLVEHLVGLDDIVVPHIRQLVHGHIVEVKFAVLHFSPIDTLILMLDDLRFLVLDHHMVVLFKINLALFPRLLHLTLRPPLLDTDMLVHLRLEDAELIHFRLTCHAQSAVALRAPVETDPEVGILIDDGGIVADGSSQVTCFV